MGTPLSPHRPGPHWKHTQGKLCWVVQCMLVLMGLKNTTHRLVNAPTLEQQQQVFDSALLVRFVKNGPALLVWAFRQLVSLVCFNRIVLWWVAAGVTRVCCEQVC